MSAPLYNAEILRLAASIPYAERLAVIGVDGAAFQKIKNADGFGYTLKAA